MCPCTFMKKLLMRRMYFYKLCGFVLNLEISSIGGFNCKTGLLLCISKSVFGPKDLSLNISELEVRMGLGIVVVLNIFFK